MNAAYYVVMTDENGKGTEMIYQTADSFAEAASACERLRHECPECFWEVMSGQEAVKAGLIDDEVAKCTA